MKISHGSQSTSVSDEAFGYPQLLNDSPTFSTCLGHVASLTTLTNCTLELLDLRYASALEGIMRLTLYPPTCLVINSLFTIFFCTGTPFEVVNSAGKKMLF